jgi:hypothetical protein
MNTIKHIFRYIICVFKTHVPDQHLCVYRRNGKMFDDAIFHCRRCGILYMSRGQLTENEAEQMAATVHQDMEPIQEAFDKIWKQKMGGNREIHPYDERRMIR